MLVPTLGVFARIGTIAAFSAQAGETVGDIVDQVLDTRKASSPDVPPAGTP